MATPSTEARRLATAGLALVLAAVLFVATNVFAFQALKGARLDLTDRGTYTLSPATGAVLAMIGEPITLRLYYSERLGAELPGLAAFAARVRELLREYESAAAGGIVLEIHDPRPFTDDEDRAVGYGLAGVPVDAGGEPAYFGLVGTNSVDDEEVIAFFQPDRDAELEYELTRTILALATPIKARIGLLSGLPLAGGMAPGQGPGAMLRPFAAYVRLTELFDVRAIRPDAAAIDEDIDALMVVHPRDLPAATAYAVDQYLMAGGAAIVFVDPLSEAEARRRPPQELFAPSHSGLDGFADSWGVSLLPDVVVGDARAAARVNVAAAGRYDTVDYLSWLRFDTDNLDRRDRITARLDRLNLASAGVLEPIDGATTALTPLIWSSPESMLIDADAVRINPDPRRLLADFRPGGESLTIAARLTGPAASAFPIGPPEGAEGADHLAQSTRPLDLVVVADTDLLDDRFWIEVRDGPGDRLAIPFADNGAFLINAIESLSGAADLSDLRGRATGDRPFERIDALHRQAEIRYRATELRLLQELEDAEAELRALSPDGAAGGVLLSETAPESLRRRVVEVRRELRDVRRSLREDVGALEARLQFVNIALVPLVIAALALVLAVVRAARRRRPSQV